MTEHDFASRLDSTAAAWFVTLPDGDAGVAEARAILAAAEQSRADRLRAASDRTAYIYGHAALRVLLEAQLGRSLAGQPFDRHEHGKPYLAAQPLGFNFSRAGGTALIGLIDGADIGVDAEAIVADGSSAGIAGAHFSPAERQWIDGAIDAGERRRRFYRLWVVHEALAKATGEGLGRAPAAAIAVHADAPVIAAGSGWHAWESPELAGYAAAAVVPEGRKVRWGRTTWADLAKWRRAANAD